MKKVERIYKETYAACRKHIEAWGLETNEDGSVIGFNGLILKDTEHMTKKNFEDFTQLLDSGFHNNDILLRYNVIDEEKHTEMKSILLMVSATLLNEYKRFKAEGRA